MNNNPANQNPKLRKLLLHTCLYFSSSTFNCLWWRP